MAGWGTTVLRLSVYLDVQRRVDFAEILESAFVVVAGEAVIVMNAFLMWAAAMEPVRNQGSAYVMKDGEASSVIKI